MPHKLLTGKARGSTFAAESFLRSINLCYDATAPERIAHFRPTAKSVPLLETLLARRPERALIVVAPYGSGKSLTATYALHLVERREDALRTLQTIEARLEAVSPALAEFSAKRRRAGAVGGLAIPLHGHHASLAQALKQAAGDALRRVGLGRQARTVDGLPANNIEEAVAILDATQDKVLEAGGDRLVILWDEFGRHIETLITEGRTSALLDLQVLAEYASRASRLPVVLAVFLHQSLLHYAGNLPQSVRSEWTKVEGRFETLQYVEDSKELYRLIGDVVAARRTLEPPAERALTEAARACQAHGLFTDCSKSELAALLARAYPLSPVALYLLPRISARVAQNERTLFTMLCGIELDRALGVDALFDYFSPAMRSDVAVGGTHRRWLETQSALTKLGDLPEGGRVLKTACLLGLGLSGERARTGRELLLFALRGYEGLPGAEKVLAQLVDRKLLLHREHADDLAVWHGTDVDLRSRLADEKARRQERFNLLAFLRREVPPPTSRPVRYNAEHCITRYLEGEYQTLAGLEAYAGAALTLASLPVDSDGQVIYVVAEDTGELTRAEEIACSAVKHDRVIVALPREPLRLTDAALEVESLLQMQRDADLVGTDPLVLPELQHLTDDARAHLQQLVDLLLVPSAAGPRWFYRGEERIARDPREFGDRLSEIMATVFASAPRLNNEMIVRKKPSAVVINARKKLLLGILERSGKENVGIEGNFPDSSIFRSVLLHTGLYRKNGGGRWTYAAPQAVRDPGLRAVWERFREFLTVAAAEPKPIAPFLDELRGPPYGVRSGVLPILFAAALKAFPSAVSLLCDGAYVTDVLPTQIEDLCREPERFRLTVLDLDPVKEKYLRQFHDSFRSAGAYEVPESDLIRACFDALEAWSAQLPAAAFAARDVSDLTRGFREALQNRTDPVRLILKRIPEILGHPIQRPRPLIQAIQRCKGELEAVVGTYGIAAADALRRAVGGKRNEDIRLDAARWASCFPEAFIEALPDRVGKGLLSRMRTEYDSDVRLMESLASLLVGKPLSRWDDATVVAFDRELQDVLRRVEEAALSADIDVQRDGDAAAGLSRLVQERIGGLYERLVRLVGEERAREIVGRTVADRAVGSW